MTQMCYSHEVKTIELTARVMLWQERLFGDTLLKKAD
jgi:hypothetical protein